MPRQPMLLAAASVVALCATACAETGKPSVSSQASANKTVPASQSTAPKTASLPGASLESEIRRAQMLRTQGNLTEAIRALAQLVLVAPDDSRVVGEYGKALVQQGRSDDAVAFLKRGIQLKPGDPNLYSALGVAYDQMDDSKNASAAYEHSLALRPGDSAVLNNYAVSRMLAHDLNGAEKLLRQAQASGGTNPKLTSNLALLAQLKAAKSTSPSQIANAATRAPHALAAAPANMAPAGVPVKPQTVVSAPTNTKAANPPVRATVVMQPVPKDSSAASKEVARTPTQTLASAPANTKPDGVARKPAQTLATATSPAKPAVQPQVHSTVMQPVPKDTPAATTKLASKPPQALPSGPMNIRPSEPPPPPAASTVVMQPVPKDAEAGPVKVAAKPVKQPGAHPPAAATATRYSKNTATRSAPAKSSLPALRTADQGE